MLGKDMFGQFRAYVRGKKEDLERFTIELTWYHSALAEIGSVNDMSNGELVLNLIVRDESREDDLWELAEEYNCWRAW